MAKQKELRPVDVVRRDSPPGKAKGTLLAIANHSDYDGQGAWVSYSRLAMETGHNVRTIRRHVKELVLSGQLVVSFDLDRKHWSNDFEIPIVAELYRKLHFPQWGRDKMTLGEGQDVPGPGTNWPTTHPIPSREEIGAIIDNSLRNAGEGTASKTTSDRILLDRPDIEFDPLDIIAETDPGLAVRLRVAREEAAFGGGGRSEPSQDETR